MKIYGYVSVFKNKLFVLVKYSFYFHEIKYYTYFLYIDCLSSSTILSPNKPTASPFSNKSPSVLIRPVFSIVGGAAGSGSNVGNGGGGGTPHNELKKSSGRPTSLNSHILVQVF